MHLLASGSPVSSRASGCRVAPRVRFFPASGLHGSHTGSNRKRGGHRRQTGWASPSPHRPRGPFTTPVKTTVQQRGARKRSRTLAPGAVRSRLHVVPGNGDCSLETQGPALQGLGGDRSLVPLCLGDPPSQGGVPLAMNIQQAPGRVLDVPVWTRPCLHPLLVPSGLVKSGLPSRPQSLALVTLTLLTNLCPHGEGPHPSQTVKFLSNLRGLLDGSLWDILDEGYPI